MTAGLVSFETTQEGVLPAGELSVDVPAQAVEPGDGGNVSAGTVRTMAVAPVGDRRLHQSRASTGGRAAEEDEELRQRILATYQRLPNGTNRAYYEQEALAVEGVAAAKVLPKNRGLGTVDVVVAAPGGCRGGAAGTGAGGFGPKAGDRGGSAGPGSGGGGGEFDPVGKAQDRAPPRAGDPAGEEGHDRLV